MLAMLKFAGSLCLAVAVLAATDAAAAETSVAISARWSGEAPSRLVIQTDAAEAPLVSDSAAAIFRGDVRLPAPVNDADLIATYNDGAELTLPLRLTAGTPSVSLAIKRPLPPKCTTQTLNLLAIPASTLGDAVHNYLAAKAINQIATNDRCGPALKRLAAKVWFDSSYALVRMKPFFRLDPGAQSVFAAAYSSQVASAIGDQAAGANLAAIYQESLSSYTAGDLDKAMALNSTMSDLIQADDQWARAAKLQGLDAGRLATDNRLFENKAGAVRQLAGN